MALYPFSDLMVWIMIRLCEEHKRLLIRWLMRLLRDSRQGRLRYSANRGWSARKSVRRRGIEPLVTAVKRAGFARLPGRKAPSALKSIAPGGRRLSRPDDAAAQLAATGSSVQ
ncbi:hypothetical protein CK228_29045 [Mesorhizobium sp. WSM4312]|nr:hypothetical protein CK228_29045 [Mesorhizobium sp. WSM4312]